MKKYVPFIITIAILAIFTPVAIFNTVSAQDEEMADQPAVVKDFEGLRAEFKQYTQSPESKEAKFEMILKSNIDSDRVKVEWTVSGASKLVNAKQQRMDLNIRKGQTYTIPVTILPLGEGITEVYGTAQSVAADSSFLVTVRKNFASNKSSEILPITSEYTQSKTLSVVKNVVITVVGVAIAIAVGFVILKRVMKYAKSEPTITFEDERSLQPPLNKPQ